MKPPADSKPPAVEARDSDQTRRRKHREQTSGFLWGTWLME